MENKTDSWEVVGSKKSGKTASPMSKAKKKAIRDKMPTIQPSAPVEESSTIYEAFIKNEERKERKAQLLQQQQQAALNQTAASAVGKKPAAAFKKENKDVKKKEKSVPLSEAVKKLDVKKFEDWLEKIMQAFPGHVDIWLKDLASLLNSELSNVNENNSVLDSAGLGSPLSALPRKVRDLMVSTLKRADEGMVNKFTLHCINKVLDEQIAGNPTTGFRMFVQLILTNHPTAVINHIDTYMEMLKPHVGRTIRALSLLWCVGQVGLAGLSYGLRVWMDVMLPVMDQRNLSNYCILYLENLLRSESQSLTLSQCLPSIYSGSEGLQKKDFFKLFDQLFTEQSPLTEELRRKMRDLYPMIKDVAWGDQSSVTLHTMFSSFLVRLSHDCSKLTRKELLNCLMECLTTDKKSFSTWRQIYTDHLTQSSILLRHLSDNLGSVDINRKLLFETVRSFHRTNEERAEDSSVTRNKDYSRCVTACEELLLKLNAPAYSWRRVVMVIIVLLVSVVIIDSLLHNGWKNSMTYRALSDWGVLTFAAHLSERFLVYCSIVYKWLSINVPYYYQKLSEVMGPYVELVWDKLKALTLLIADKLHPVYLWFKAQAPVVLQWLERTLPVVLEVIGTYVGIVLTLVLNSLMWISHQAQLFYQWLLSNVLVGEWSPENLYKLLTGALLGVQSYMYKVYIWCSGLVTAPAPPASN